MFDVKVNLPDDVIATVRRLAFKVEVLIDRAEQQSRGGGVPPAAVASGLKSAFGVLGSLISGERAAAEEAPKS